MVKDIKNKFFSVLAGIAIFSFLNGMNYSTAEEIVMIWTSGIITAFLIINWAMSK